MLEWLFALTDNVATIPVCYQWRADLKSCCNSPSGSTVSIMSCQQQKQTPLLGIAPLRSRTYNRESCFIPAALNSYLACCNQGPRIQGMKHAWKDEQNRFAKVWALLFETSNCIRESEAYIKSLIFTVKTRKNEHIYKMCREKNESGRCGRIEKIKELIY